MTFMYRMAAAFAALLLFAFICSEAPAAEWMPLSGAVHVHSSEFSSGGHRLVDLVNMAREREVDVIILNDHDLIAMSYGLPPFRNLFSLTVSQNSVLKRGAREYLETVNAVDQENPDILLIPGLESAPFYYWKGSVWKGELVSHDWRKHIHILGLDKPEDFENLPLLHNGLSARYVTSHLPGFLLFAGVILVSIILIFQGGTSGKVGKIFLIIGLLGAFDAHPFKSSPYDPFNGEQGVLPYQELIDYVRERGGMTFWAHPEANYGVKKSGFKKTIAGVTLPQVHMTTDTYPNDLIQTYDYTGFESLYGDTIHATDPNHEWDRVLLQYCNGERERPVWGICGLDFHKENQNSWSKLDRGQTIFWVRERSREAVLDAMMHGRTYAVFQGGASKIQLDNYSLSLPYGNTKAISGGMVESRGDILELSVSLSMKDASSVPIEIDLIESGKRLFTLKGETPMRISRKILPSRSKGYVRLMVRSQNYRIVTNPIFYKDLTK